MLTGWTTKSYDNFTIKIMKSPRMCFVERGIRTIINFRGETNQAAFFLEKEACRRYNINLINFTLFATKLPQKRALLELEDIYKQISHPFLMHCKSGSDRAGLGAALYFIYILHAPIKVAQKQLSIK